MRTKLILLLALAASTALNITEHATNRKLRDSTIELMRANAKLQDADAELKSADAHLKDRCDTLAHNAELLMDADRRLQKACH